MKQDIIRQNILRQRATLEHDFVQSASSQISSLIFQHPQYKAANTIGVYASFKNEVSTDLIIEKSLAMGKKISLPIVSNKQITFHSFSNDTEITANKYGITEPCDTSPLINCNELDLIIMPLVACDPKGNRIGMGGGYYDRLLSAHTPHPYRIGLAYEFQLITNSYPKKWDEKVNSLITEKKVYNF